MSVAAAPRFKRPNPGTRLGLRAGDALLVIDVQRDFMPGGSLAVPDGDQVVAPLNACIAAFHARRLPIFLSRDWHPADHCSFRQSGGRWPPHCVAGTQGAQWAKGLQVAPGARIVSKAMDRETEAYSAFGDTALLVLLRDLRVARLFVGGVATDYCVHATVIAALAHGFQVVVLADAIRGINAQAGDDSRALSDMVEHGASLVQVRHAVS